LANGQLIDYGLLVWSTGLKQNALIESVQGVQKEQGGMRRLLTDAQLRVLHPSGQLIDNIYAVGDCATVQDYSLPCTAQVARQKAEYLSKMLNNVAKVNETVPAFKYAHKGSMAYVGGWKAIVDQLGGGQQRQIGTLAWLIWRGAYMSMADSWRNRIKIPTYWLLTWLSGRETSRF
jgi:NADH dehydrogenase FAD-containing subunit